MTLRLLALVVFLAPAGHRAAREGLDLLGSGDAAAAEARFRAAISELSPARVEAPAETAVLAAAWTGVGLALLDQGDAAAAAAAFDTAMTWTSDDSTAATLLYDAGTALARAERWDEAKERLERALLLRPGYADARHNLEVVIRRTSRPPPPTGGRPPEPSEFAQMLRRQADSLVAIRRYGDALDLLQEGLARDSTVSAFADVMRRLEAVVGIVDSTGDAR